MLETRPALRYGRFLQKLVRLRQRRVQNPATFFYRNRPELALLGHLADTLGARSPGPPRILVLGCSKGAECYSIIHALGKRGVDVRVRGVDVEPAELEVAAAGCYDSEAVLPGNATIHHRLTAEEVADIFDTDGRRLQVKSWIRRRASFCVADARDRHLPQQVGVHDIVVANRFLCHMDPPEAEQCLRNIARVVAPGGYLLASGIDLDVRTRVARTSGWRPVAHLLEAVHDGDVSLRQDWPWEYWCLEPLDPSLPDWATRFASAFRLPPGALVSGVRARTESRAR